MTFNHCAEIASSDAGSGPCALIGPHDAGGWGYRVACPYLKRQVQGRREQQTEAMQEARFWLEQFQCRQRDREPIAIK